MWKLPVPNTDSSSDDITSALTYVNGNAVFPITDDQKRVVLDLYHQYNRFGGQPAAELVGEALEQGLLQAMHDAYNEVHDNRRLANLRSRIKLAAQICPYCGFGEIKDIDHHLPRSKYKALAIYSNNLVPTCHPCNNKKRTVAGLDPDSQFFHTYLGTLPNEEFLIAAASILKAALVVNFSITQSANMALADYNRISFQFERLDLNTRYQAEVSTFITSHRTAIEMASSGGGNVLKDYLEKASSHSAEDFGLNDWRTALWRGLARCPDFYNGGFKHAFGIKNPGA